MATPPTTNLVYRIRDRTTFRNLESAHEPVPTIEDDQVLVRVRGVTLNYRDLIICNGEYLAPTKDNLVPCADSAGDVVAVGPKVHNVKVGDRVVTTFNLYHTHEGELESWDFQLGGAIDGVLREYMPVPAQSVTPIPEECTLSYVQLASLVASGSTSFNALFGGPQPLRPGQTVLLLGTGGVSIAGLQYAKAAGANAIITSSSDEKLAFVKEKFGANHIINYRKTPNWAEEVTRVTGGRGVDHVLETGGAGTIEQSIRSSRAGGVVSIIGFLASPEKKELPDVAMLTLFKQAILRGVQVGSTQLMRELVRFVTNQKIQPHVDKTFSFSSREQVLAAFEYLESNRQIGKIGIEL